MKSALLTAAAVAAMGLALGGCERQQVTVYKQGTYQGKPDTRPWENAPFSGNEAEWERVIKARNQSQSEYKHSR